MAISAGARVGPYQVTDQIGSGGMGVVYRATDTKLKRDVAIKMLPAALANDAERLARFRREAEVLASLNHPNVAHIHGLEESDGTTALILELVEGPTLADRIAEGALPIDEALDIAIQIAGALEAAHGQGIVHRDLKPANIKLKADGTVKVLDFGIAKALDIRAASGLSPVMETPTVTETGIILGTAAYMSPEQARGKGVDQRTDIWAFGCVLFEMLTGQQAFGGEDVTVMLARILERGPNMDALPRAVPPAVRHTIELCLEKDVRQRIADIRDVKLSVGGKLVPAGFVEGRLASEAQGRRRLTIAGAALLIGIIVTASIAWMVRPSLEPQPVNRFAYVVPAGHDFRWAGESVLALSPDGRQFVYNTEDGLYLRRMNDLAARLIPGTEEDLSTPLFAPDGQSVAYWSADDEQLERIPLVGGAPTVIATDVRNPLGASWSLNGMILFSQPDGIYGVSASGGSRALLIASRENEELRGPQLLPDGDSVLFTRLVDTESDSMDEELDVQSISTGNRTALGLKGADARYLPTGHLVYAFEQHLFAVEFDPDTFAVGAAVPMLQGTAITTSGSANYGVADDGTLVYLRPAPEVQETRSIVWVDREGHEEPLLTENRSYDWTILSPDNRQLAAWIGDHDNGDPNGDLWLFDVSSGQGRPITFGTRPTETQIWDWSGQRIAYGSERGIDWQAVDGTGEPEVLVENTTEQRVYPYSFSPNNEYFVFGQFGQGWEIHMLSMQSGAAPEPLITDFRNQWDAKISPDGKWIAYLSNESGTSEAYVRPFPNLGAKWQVSRGEGAALPLKWRPDGRELFYFQHGSLTAVSIETEPTFDFGVPEALFPLSEVLSGDPSYAPTSDGRFVVVKVTTDESTIERPQIIIVENWIEELEQLTPTQ